MVFLTFFFAAAQNNEFTISYTSAVAGGTSLSTLVPAATVGYSTSAAPTVRKTFAASTVAIGQVTSVNVSVSTTAGAWKRA